MRSPRTALVSLILLAALGLTSCGDDAGTGDAGDSTGGTSAVPTPTPTDAEPAVCQDVQDLAESLASLGELTMEKGALADLQAKVDSIGQVVEDLRANASDEFADQADLVGAALQTLGDTLADAVASPGAATLSAVSAALTDVTTQIQTLSTDVAGTC